MPPKFTKEKAEFVLKKLWYFATNKRWGPGEVVVVPWENSIADSNKVVLGAPDWKLLVWTVAKATVGQSYSLEARVAILTEHLEENNWFKRKIKRLTRKELMRRR